MGLASYAIEEEEEKKIIKELYKALKVVEDRNSKDLLTTGSLSPPSAADERDLLYAIIDFALAYA
jgi:hypothetical protein